MPRGTALSLGILVPLFFLVSDVLGNPPGVESVAQYLPNLAGMQITRAVAGDRVGVGAWEGSRCSWRGPEPLWRADC